MFITEKEDEHKKTIYRRTDYSDFERGRSVSLLDALILEIRYFDTTFYT